MLSMSRRELRGAPEPQLHKLGATPHLAIHQQ